MTWYEIQSPTDRQPEPQGARGPDTELPSMLYARCDGCDAVTAHGSTQVVRVPCMLNVSQRGRVSPVELVEIVCSRCDGSQPRVIGDAVLPDTVYTCAGRQSWRQAWRRCEQMFTAPSAAPYPTCPDCGTVADARRPRSGADR